MAKGYGTTGISFNLSRAYFNECIMGKQVEIRCIHKGLWPAPIAHFTQTIQVETDSLADALWDNLESLSLFDDKSTLKPPLPRVNLK